MSLSQLFDFFARTVSALSDDDTLSDDMISVSEAFSDSEESMTLESLASFEVFSLSDPAAFSEKLVVSELLTVWDKSAVSASLATPAELCSAESLPAHPHNVSPNISAAQISARIILMPFVFL